jgi:hypothetical protein
MKKELIASILTWSILATAITFIFLSIMNSGEIALYNLLGSLFALISVPVVHFHRKLKDKSKLKNEY